MKDQAIAICRVSTPEQRRNNSLNRQEESVREAADRLNVSIVMTWSGDASSKVGRNVNRKDLNEAWNYCKKHRRVKYLIVDEVDRFMRSIKEMFYWIVRFEELGVKTHFASNHELNGDDAKARLFLSLDGFKSEGSNEERQHKSVSGHEKAIREGRYTFVPKPGYKKGTEPGVHVPHEITFKPLQNALQSVANGLASPQQALKELNASKFSETHAIWRMDRFRHFAIDPYYAGILKVDKQVKAHNQTGLHQAMISLEEHEQLLRVFNGSIKLRGNKKQYNPQFPMNKLLTCGDCGSEVKFTGSKKNNGYSRKHTTYYYKYHCRGCGKGYHRDQVHSAITKRLDEVVYRGAQESDFIEALCEVWKTKQKDKLRKVAALQQRVVELEKKKSQLIVALATLEPEYHNDIKGEVDTIKLQIANTKSEIEEYNSLDEDMLRFIDFAVRYTDKLAGDWWELDYDGKLQCQQLIFPGGISFNSDKKVGTTELSAIYSLQPNKKALDFASKALMVELVGTAPTSAGLSWLVVYRHSSFCCLKK